MSLSNTAFNTQINGSAAYHKPNIPTTTTRNTTAQPSHPRHPQQHQAQQQRHAPSNLTSQPAPNNTAASLLPYCTAGPPLRQSQVIALSDIVGSLKELTLLARGDAACRDKLVGAVGRETASEIVDFFAEEWEVE
ncbi:hypothetical protein CC86DRAFT_430955 [Ophiobolus disseminans]|uniref:Uncharacterized protein n=1 Tax=Ophiobolus disseminans TaxID=1469910 RepID=A0A6A7AD30_9PLEO|nr:hypothetical protein CC86DRAFT_430955 [Ophiobolus disseminans]